MFVEAYRTMLTGICTESVYFRYNSSNEDNFGQATMYWDTLTTEQKKNLELNVAEHLKGAAPFLQVSETTT
jgi:catalase